MPVRPSTTVSAELRNIGNAGRGRRTRHGLHVGADPGRHVADAGPLEPVERRGEHVVDHVLAQFGQGALHGAAEQPHADGGEGAPDQARNEDGDRDRDDRPVRVALGDVIDEPPEQRC